MKVILAFLGLFLLYRGHKFLIANNAPRKGFWEVWNSLSNEKAFSHVERWEEEGKPTPNHKSCAKRQSYSWS